MSLKINTIKIMMMEGTTTTTTTSVATVSMVPRHDDDDDNLRTIIMMAFFHSTARYALQQNHNLRERSDLLPFLSPSDGHFSFHFLPNHHHQAK